MIFNINIKKLFIISAEISFFYLGYREYKLFRKNFLEKKKYLKKQEAALDSYKQWIQLYQNNKSIEKYLQEHNYNSIAIYGMGRIGKNLFDELSKSEVKIDYIIDNYLSMAKGSYQSVPCYNPKSVLPETNLIIVTVSSEADDIILQLADCGSPTISIQNLMHRMIS